MNPQDDLERGEKPVIRLPEPEIQKRVRSLRRFSGQSTDVDPAISGVTGTILGFLTWLLRLLRLPLALVAGGITFYLMYPLNTCLLTGGVAVAVAVGTFMGLVLLVRVMEITAVKSKLRSKMDRLD